MKTRLTFEERLVAYSDRSGGPDACWPWRLGTDRHGYGRMVVGSRRHTAHRVAYEALVGPVPAGFDVDHVCHTIDSDCPGGNPCLHRRCVNPRHLEAVPRKVNILRGKSFTAESAVLTACRKGHPFTAENTYRAPGKTWRRCRACQRGACRQYRSRRGGD